MVIERWAKFSELIVVEEGFKHDTDKSITVMNMERALTIAQKMSPKVEPQEQSKKGMLCEISESANTKTQVWIRNNL